MDQRLPIPATLDGERLDRVLSLIWDLPRSQATELIASGAVRLEGRPVASRARRVAGGQELEVVLPDRSPSVVAGERGGDAPPLVHVDDHVIVVDKPAGVVVHPGAGSRPARWSRPSSLGSPTWPRPATRSGRA